MLEHIPGWLGRSLRSLRAGHARLAVATLDLPDALAALDLASPAFGDGARLPVRFTADGEGVSPPLVWGVVPEGTRSLALIVEDPDAPFPEPLVHAIVIGIAPDALRFEEGAIVADGPGGVGRNSFFREGWLPPDPPTGHGMHDYVFQLFALDVEVAPDVSGRVALARAITGHVLGVGVLTGTYSREEAATSGPLLATA